MTNTGRDVVDPQPGALDAAAEAFAAARSARRLLDGAGRRGAAAVNRSHPIPGARRASTKAQASLEDAARKLEEARDPVSYTHLARVTLRRPPTWAVASTEEVSAEDSLPTAATMTSS